MGVQAQWSTMRWEVSPERVKTLGELSASRSVTVERNDDKEGEPATQTVALDLMTVSLSYDVYRSALGSDPRREYGKWWELVGTHAPFFLGGQKFMADSLLLLDAKASNIVCNSTGHVLSLTIDLEFEEYAEDASGLKTEKGREISLTPGVYTWQQPSSAASMGASDPAYIPSNPGM